jgi:hypothetical protein
MVKACANGSGVLAEKIASNCEKLGVVYLAKMFSFTVIATPPSN